MLPSETTQVTLGEVGRKVDNLAEQVSNLAQSVSAAPNWRDFQALETRVKDAEDWQKWFIRIVLGLVIAAIIGAVIVVK
jgi:tetrahydromethanopterin S-methyltransferase subunit B